MHQKHACRMRHKLLTLHEAVAGGTDEVGALGSDAVPGPLEHLDDDILAARRGPGVQGVSIRARVEGSGASIGDGEENAEGGECGEFDPLRHAGVV